MITVSHRFDPKHALNDQKLLYLQNKVMMANKAFAL